MRLYEILNEMITSPPTKTGLSTPVWISDTGGRHGPRIKVSNNIRMQRGSNTFSVSISKTPKIVDGISHLSQKEINNIYKWVILNYDMLMSIYNAFKTRSYITVPDKNIIIDPNFAFNNLLTPIK